MQFPNVRAAENETNQQALATRHEQAQASAARRGISGCFATFEAALKHSRAVLGRSTNEVERLASSERQGYATYYQLIDSQARLPDHDSWEPLRRIADVTLFPGYHQHMRFLALSLDDLGIHSYGDCFLVCRDSMIAHRATLFEMNSAVFIGNQHVPVNTLPLTVVGRRATWAKRAMLCAAKLEQRLSADTSVDDFAKILMSQGTTPADDDFVEVNIYGPMTIRTFCKAIVHGPKPRRKRAFLASLREKLAHYDVELEIR